MEEIKDLKRVMEKVGNKEFWTFLMCKKPIPVGRLLIRPENLYFVHCFR